MQKNRLFRKCRAFTSNVLTPCVRLMQLFRLLLGCDW